MTRGEAVSTKIHYKGKDEDFIVFAENADIVRKWKKDSSIPLTEVVQSFKVFVTHKHGSQGAYDGASNAALENEFGTKQEDEVIKKILQEGNLQESEFPEREGNRNFNNGTLGGH